MSGYSGCYDGFGVKWGGSAPQTPLPSRGDPHSCGSTTCIRFVLCGDIKMSGAENPAPFHADMSAMVDGLLKRMAEQAKRMAEQKAEQDKRMAEQIAGQIAEQDKRMAEQMAEQDQMIESLRKKIESLSEALPDAKRQKVAEQDKRMAERTLQN